MEELRRAVEEDRLTLLPVEQALGVEAKYSARDLADRAELPVEFLVKQLQAVGLPKPDLDEPLFGEHDAKAARDLAGMRSAGIPDDAIHETARVIGEAMARVADASRQVVGRSLIRPGDTERDLGLRYAEATRALVPLMASQLEYVFRVHLREQLRNTMLDQAALAAGRLPGAQDVTVCFADLVGFTKLGEAVGPEELGSVVGRLNDMAGEAVEPPVRLVKTIGDAAMIVGPEPVPVVTAALRMVELAQDAGDEFPSLRSGVASGATLERAGDFYGSPVNVASRVTGIAYPASVLVTEDVHDAAEDEFRWSSAGRKKLKGVREPQPLFRARFPEPAG